MAKKRRGIILLSLVLLIVLLLVVMCSVFFVACQNGTKGECEKEEGEVEFSVAFRDQAMFGKKRVETGGVQFGVRQFVNTLEELQTLCQEWGNPAFDQNDERYDSKLSQKLREYNETFFEKKVLLIYSAIAYNLDLNPQVDKAIVRDSSLILRIKEEKLFPASSAIAQSLTFYIEFNKSDVANVVEIFAD